MFKNAHSRLYSMEGLAAGLVLVIGVSLTSCASHRCKGPGGDTHNVTGGAVSWCDWEIVDSSGRKPNWKKSVDSAKGEYCGEGVGETLAEARKQAEDDMRIQVARYLKTEVKSIMILRETESSEQYDGQHQVEVDNSVKRMAVDDFYWEQRKRIGHQHGLEIPDQDYHVLVIGTVDR